MIVALLLVRYKELVSSQRDVAQQRLALRFEVGEQKRLEEALVCSKEEDKSVRLMHSNSPFRDKDEIDVYNYLLVRRTHYYQHQKRQQ